QVVEADRDTRAGACRDDVVRRVADLDIGDLEVRRLEPFVALVENESVELGKQRDEPRQRVVGEVRVGDVTFAAFDLEEDVHRAAPPGLHRVAETGNRGR